MGDGIGVGIVIQGRYELEEELGEGAFGQVYKARDLNLARRPVAVKVLQEEFGKYAEIIERFENESVALAHVQHPNIVNIVDRGAWQGRRYLVTEYVQGQTLQQWIDEHRARGVGFPGELASRVFEQICAGVDEAHRLVEPGPIVHRDIKPSNVMLRRNDDDEIVVKVLDFGVAQLGATHHTRTGVLLGTPYSMAPEQILGRAREVGPATDVFALAVLLVEMLAPGGGLVEDETWWSVVLDDESSVLGRLRRLPAKVPATVWTTVSHALRKNPRSRHATAGAFRRAVRAAFKGEASPEPRGDASARRDEVLEPPAAPTQARGAAPNPPTEGPGTVEPAAMPRSGPTGTLTDGEGLDLEGLRAAASAVEASRSVARPTSSGGQTVVWESPSEGGTSSAGRALPPPALPTPPAAPLIAPLPLRSAEPTLHSASNRGAFGAQRTALVAVGVLVLGVGAWLAFREPSSSVVGGATTAASATASVSATGSVSAAPPPPPCPEGMVKIAGGRFLMGSPEGVGEADERPQRLAAVEDFCIDVTEVSVKAYRDCVGTGRCPAPESTVKWERIMPVDSKSFDPTCNGQKPDRDQHPMNCIGWSAATDFCHVRGGRAADRGPVGVRRARGRQVALPVGRRAARRDPRQRLRRRVRREDLGVHDALGRRIRRQLP